ncbi:MAG TPA: META domain-containing protein [Dehalococcoidia bacterium]|nr:META domain-containing protein [Dehalococcoidia bacterium]
MAARTPIALVVASLAAAVSAASAACGGGGSALDDTTWNLVGLDGGPAAEEAAAWITFEGGGDFTGSTGCNSIGGRWKASGETLTFSDISTTLIACEGPLGVQDAMVVEALRETVAFAMGDGTLRLIDRDGAARLTFAAAP